MVLSASEALCSSHQIQPSPLSQLAEIGPSGRFGGLKTAPNAIFAFFSDFARIAGLRA